MHWYVVVAVVVVVCVCVCMHVFGFVEAFVHVILSMMLVKMTKQTRVFLIWILGF